METVTNQQTASWPRAWLYGIPAVLVAITTLVYYKTLWYDFIFDDLPTITNYFHNRVLDVQGQFFSNPRWISRVLNQLTYHYWGNAQFPYRIVNFIFFIAIGLLIFATLMRVFTRLQKNSFVRDHALSITSITTMLFLLHPAQTQTATYITQMRLEGLVVLFTMATLSCFVFGVTTNNAILKKILFGLSFVLAAFAGGTKEAVVVMPMLIALFDWFFIAEGEWQSFKSRLWLHAGYCIMLYGVMIRYGVLTPHYVNSVASTPVHNNRGNVLTDHATHNITLPPFFISQFKVVLHYLSIFLFPVGLCFDYDVKLSTAWYNLDVIVPFMILAAMAAGAAWLYRRNTAHFLTFVTAWFFISILPRASIFPSTELICDYKTFLSSVGVMMGLAYLIVYGTVRLVAAWPMMMEIQHKPWAKLSAQAAFCAILAIASNARNFVWSSELVFWYDVLAKAPKARVYNNIAIALWEKGQTKEAIDLFNQAIAKDDWYAEPHVNLATIYQVANDVDKALEHYKRALEIGEGHPELFNNLGMLHFTHQSYQSAEYCFKQAIALRFHHSKAHINLGKLYHLQNRREAALACYENALRGDYQDRELYYLYGTLCFEMGQPDKAIASLEKVNKDFMDTAFVLGCAYYSKYQYPKATECFAVAYRKEPHNKIYVYNYAQALMNTRQYKDAIQLYNQCLNELDKYPYAPLHTAKCLYELGMKKEAKRALAELIKKTKFDNVKTDALTLQRDLKLG
jgi:tetratricopeptide (TPR) repeat protein